MFDRDEIEARLEGVVYLPETESTNRVARRLRVGSVVVADHQTGGRGRLGRTWVSPPGENLLLSIVMPAPTDPARAPRMTLLWAAAIAEALDVRVKWPNDLMSAEGGKLGGILSELDHDDGVIRRIIVGIGINVNQTEFPPELTLATSLCLVRGVPQDRLGLLLEVVEAVNAVREDDALELWRARSLTLGRIVEVDGRRGLASSVREDGALIVDGQVVTTGDVTLPDQARPPRG